MKETIKLPQPPKKHNYKRGLKLDPSRVLLLISLFCLAFTVVASLVIRHGVEELSVLNAITLPISRDFNVQFSDKFPGSTEEITVKANPIEVDDNAATLRLQTTNAQVLDFTAATNMISIGTCNNGLSFTDNQVCVDIAKSSSFIPGESLGVMLVRWGENGTTVISSMPGNGYVSGARQSETSTATATALFNVQAELPLTGSATSQGSLVTPLLIIGILFLATAVIVFFRYDLRHKFKDAVSVKPRTCFIIAVLLCLATTAAIIWQVAVTNGTQLNINQLPQTGSCSDSEILSCTNNCAIDCSCVDGEPHCALASCKDLQGPNQEKTRYVLGQAGLYCYQNIFLYCDKVGGGTQQTLKFDNNADCIKECLTRGDNCKETYAENKFSAWCWSSNKTGEVCTDLTGYQNVKLDCKIGTKTACENCRMDGTKPVCGPITCKDTETLCGTECCNKDTQFCAHTGTDQCLFCAKEGQSCMIDAACCGGTNLACVSGKCVANPCNAILTAVKKGKSGDYCNSDKSKLLTCKLASDGKSVTTTKINDCANGCKVNSSGPPDACKAAPTTPPPTTAPPTTAPPTTAPPTTAPPTTAPPTTVPPTTTTPTPPPGGMECGDMKCTSDDQCVTGLPDYECDQSTDPSKNQCKKICNVGERGTADCPCSPNTHKGPKITCGAIDVDGDGQLTAIDLAAFALDYNSVCTDTAPTTGCEGKDTNKDKMVDYVDLASFATRYHTVAASCVPK